MFKDPVTQSRAIGVGFVVVGVVLLVGGWYGAARLNHVAGQIPYLISGGLGGVVLIGAGIALMAINEARRDRREIAARLDRLYAGLAGGVVATNGHSAEAVGEPTVVTGTTTFHRTTCRLVQGRDDLTVAPASVAAGRGLRPCRICAPEPVEV